MTWEKAKEHIKKTKAGAGFIEADESYAKSFHELDAHLATFVVWITGLGLGELAFILSKLDSLFTTIDVLLLSTLFSLACCVFFGLTYHLIRIVYLWLDRQFYFASKEISLAAWIAESGKEVGTELENSVERMGKNLKGHPKKSSWALKGLELSGAVSIIMFFLGSFLFTFLITCEITR